MQVTTEYLEDFAVQTISDYKEIPLHGWEMEHNGAVTLDDKDGHSIGFLHWDDWPAEKSWKIKKGTDKRWTLVRLYDKDGAVVGDHAWEFEGLVEPALLREWFRAHLGFNE
jgi:hypothetical protein